ncbi:MAG: class I SAM-dependent methyltransferase [Hyphomicrobiaceae bacterium]
MSDSPADNDLPYDPALRRDTPLALKLKERIRADGPITLVSYMRACLTDPEHGYYVRQQAIGATGDFVTAPEISQVFGELVGLWAAVVWQQMGAPQRFNLVELGPGRGTMMRDALRATKVLPGFLDAATLILVDVAPMDGLADVFAAHLPSARIQLCQRMSDIPPDIPTILLANEFLDTCPVQQYVVKGNEIELRAVGLDRKEQLDFITLPCGDHQDASEVFAANPTLRDADCYEAQDLSVLHKLRMHRTAPWTGLFLDYGHYDPTLGEDQVVIADTFQAVRNHHYEHPLTSPGEADLTCQVNFNDVKRWFEQNLSRDFPPVTVDGPTTQAEFLGALGIMERASRLMSANPDIAHEIELAVARLMAVPGMGDRFKAIGARSPELPKLPGF